MFYSRRKNILYKLCYQIQIFQKNIRFKMYKTFIVTMLKPFKSFKISFTKTLS